MEVYSGGYAQEKPDDVRQAHGGEDRIELLLLRHGATPSNAQGRYLGRTDEPVSGPGKRELLQKEEKYEFLNPERLFSGPKLRCRETAKLLFGEDPVLIPEWTEIDFGRFEGKNYQDLDGDPEYQAWIDSGGTLPFPGGESREAFIRRSVQGLDRMLSEVKGPARAAAVVHGGTVMALLSTLTGGEYFDFYVKNGEGYLLFFTEDEEGRPVLSEYKSTS